MTNPDQTAADQATIDEAAADESTRAEAAIVATVLDYFDGWFDGHAIRMARALHPDLAKRALERDGQALNGTTAAEMIEATAQGMGRNQDPGVRGIQVTVEDIHDTIANVTVRSAVYREYVHLVRTPAGWKIVNTLYART